LNNCYEVMSERSEDPDRKRQGGYSVMRLCGYAVIKNCKTAQLQNCTTAKLQN